jgi:hypothetical protein
MPKQKQDDDDRQRQTEQPKQDVRHFRTLSKIFFTEILRSLKKLQGRITKNEDNDTGWLSLQAQPKVLLSRALYESEPEHMVEREAACLILQPMETEQPAGGVADQHIAHLARRLQRRGREMVRGSDDFRTGTSDLDR